MVISLDGVQVQVMVQLFVSKEEAASLVESVTVVVGKVEVELGFYGKPIHGWCD